MNFFITNQCNQKDDPPRVGLVDKPILSSGPGTPFDSVALTARLKESLVQPQRLDRLVFESGGRHFAAKSVPNQGRDLSLLDLTFAVPLPCAKRGFSMFILVKPSWPSPRYQGKFGKVLIARSSVEPLLLFNTTSSNRVTCVRRFS